MTTNLAGSVYDDQILATALRIIDERLADRQARIAAAVEAERTAMAERRRAAGTCASCDKDALGPSPGPVAGPEEEKPTGVSSWIPAAKILPASIAVVLVVSDGTVWPGWHDGVSWRYVDGMPMEKVTHWMHFPAAPKVAT